MNQIYVGGSGIIKNGFVGIYKSCLGNPDIISIKMRLPVTIGCLHYVRLLRRSICYSQAGFSVLVISGENIRTGPRSNID